MTQVKSTQAASREYSGAKIVSLDLYKSKIQGHINLFTHEERVGYLKKFGSHCLSFSAFQPKMDYFDMPGYGFIAFREKWGKRFVLADPICDEKDSEILIREFLKDGKDPIFVQISQRIAELIHRKFGYYSTQFGVEIDVDLENWDLKGKKKQILRTSVNHAKKEGVEIFERHTTDGCRQLTSEWLKTRKVKNREIVFLIRTMDMDYQEGTRKFYAYQNGQLIGFIFFDPVYKDNLITGYVPNISRFSNSFKSGIFYPLMIHAMDVFKKEGIKELHLGLCPLVTDDTLMPCESGVLKMLNRLLYNHANWIFSFKGLYFTKSRFGGVDRKIFGGTRDQLPLRGFFTLLKMCEIL